MPKYSEQDLKYAARFREEIHREALAIVRKTHPNVTDVIDRHLVEDYFQEHWDYPGQWYTVVAIPYGYKSRKAFVGAIVRDTLAGNEPLDTRQPRETAKTPSEPEGTEDAYDRRTVPPETADDPVDRLIADYPDLVVDYCLVQDKQYRGYDSHRLALKTAFARLCRGWKGNPERAAGKSIAAAGMFSSEYQQDKLNYRKAFLYPPHPNGYTGKDFVRVNAALFPNGTDELEVYEWTTDWSEFFDEGREWWGTLCLTVYDKTLRRFVVIMASATD